MFGIGVAVPVFAHPFGVVHHHLVVQAADLRLGMDIVQLPDIKIAEPESLLQLHAVLPAHPGDHRGGDHKVVFHVGHRVAGQNAHPLLIFKPGLLTVAAHCLHIAVGHRPVKQKFLGRLPVEVLVDVVVCLNHQPFILVAHGSPPP